MLTTHRAIIVTAFLAVLIHITAYAEDEQRLYRSAYYLGRGDTGMSIADDQEAVMYNPAGIALGKGIYKRIILASPSVEFSQDAKNLATELQNDSTADIPNTLRERIGKNEHIGIYNLTAIVLRRAAMGVFNSATTDILIHKDPDAGGLEGAKANAVTTNGAVFALAQDFFSQRLMIGANVKYLMRGEANLNANVTDAESLKNMKASDLYGIGTGVSTDVGVLFKIPTHMDPTFAMTVNNVGGTKFTSTSASSPTPNPLKQLVNLGVSIQPGTHLSRFKLLAEYWDATNALKESKFKKIHLGGELSVRDIFGVTAGMSEGWTSGGVYLDLYAIRLDTGIYIQEMDTRAGYRPDKRIFVRLTVGL